MNADEGMVSGCYRTMQLAVKDGRDGLLMLDDETLSSCAHDFQISVDLFGKAAYFVIVCVDFKHSIHNCH